MVDEAGPQNQYVDDQNFDVDIEKIYKNFIVEIDKIRSHVSVQNNPGLNTITTVNASQAPTNVNMDKNPQESRCHAFYRLLGLPVTDGTTLYTPGFDLLNNNDETYKKKLTIAQSLFKKDKVKDLLDAKENMPRDFLATFSVQDVEAMVLAMSLAEIRSLKSSFEKVGDIFDTDQSNISYPTNLAARLINTVQNKVGRHADPSKVTATRKHILTPLIVDPRIDFNVHPKRNMLTVPFVKDKTQTAVSDGVFLKRPYIEKVCRDRFNTTPTVTTLGTQTKNIIDNIKNNPYIKSDKLIQSAFNPDKITSETIQFANFFNSIRSVLVRLKESVDKVSPVLAADPHSNGMAHYNWTPIPNKSGPEFGSTTRDLLDGQANDPNNTDKDLDIISLLYSQGLANISNKLSTTQNPDVGGFAFDGTELTPDNNSSDSFGDLTEPQILAYNNLRTNETDAANSALRTIEIIMGEFSGLGLIDILVISSAFWVVDKASLLGLLDDTAIDRMLLIPNLQAAEVKARKSSGAQIQKSLTDFQNKIKEIYEVCDQLWQEIQTGNIK